MSQMKALEQQLFSVANNALTPQHLLKALLKMLFFSFCNALGLP